MRSNQKVLNDSSWGPTTVVVCSLAYAVVFIYMLCAHPGSQKFYEGFFNIYQILPPVFASICGTIYFFRGKHAHPNRRIGLFLVSLGCLSFAIGQTTWTYYETFRGVEVPFPGWADAGYLGSYPCLIIGVVMIFASVAYKQRTRLILDSMIAASSIAMLSWHFVIERLWNSSDTGLIGKIIGAAYPLGDVIAIFGVIVIFNTATTDKELRRSLAFIAIGMAMIAFADTVFTIMTLDNTYHTGSWADWGWSFGWLLIGFSFLTPMWWPIAAANVPDAKPMRRQQIVKLFLPYIAAMGSFVIVAIHDYDTPPLHQIGNSTLIAGMVLIMMVVARQMLTVLDNQRLTAEVRSINEGLEETIDQRTRQLQALNQLSKAVNTTLDIEKVMTEALDHARRAVVADGAVICLHDPSGIIENYQDVVRSVGISDNQNLMEWINSLTPSQRMEMLPLKIDENREDRGVYLRVPLKSRNHVLGTIGFIRYKGGFAATESDLVDSISLEIGAALENAHQYSAAIDAADRDPVTGLFNHRAIHQRLDKQFEAAQTLRQKMSIIMMDVDNFKLFNDTYGHPAGDQVLKRIAQGLKNGCNETHQIGRYGGDEFIVILPGMSAAEAKVLASSLRDQIMVEGFRKSGEERVVPVAISFGIANFPNDAANRHELLVVADLNLYAAKESEDGIGVSSDTQHMNRQLRSESSFGILDAMVTAVDKKDRYTSRHSEDVTEYALWIAEELGLSDETMRDMRIAGLLHDVGKITVPDEILRKPGRLTAEEYEIMKRHPSLGALIVGALPGMDSILDGVRYHHERWDGQGYPDALSGDSIPLLGRVLAVADAVSAMTTTRPYRQGMEWAEAMEQVRQNIGTQFDPVMARAFLRAAEKRKPSHEMPLQKAA